MDLAEQAFVAERQRDALLAKRLYARALELEQAAAECLLLSEVGEPTRTVLHMSAASLAKKCENLPLAERLACQGLAGFGPEELRDDLRNLIEDINFSRHFEVDNYSLGDDEFQLSMTGPAVGYGVAEASQFTPRAEATTSLLTRAAERLENLPWRTSGQASKKIRDNFKTLISVPLAASFAVRVKLSSRSREVPLFEKTHDRQQDVLEEMNACLSLAEARDFRRLADRISESVYYRGFLSDASAVAADGRSVTGVGYTGLSGDSVVILRNEVREAMSAERVVPESRLSIRRLVVDVVSSAKKPVHPHCRLERRSASNHPSRRSRQSCCPKNVRSRSGRERVTSQE